MDYMFKPINDILRVSLKPVPDLLQFVKLFIIRNSPNNPDKAAVNYFNNDYLDNTTR